MKVLSEVIPPCNSVSGSPRLTAGFANTHCSFVKVYRLERTRRLFKCEGGYSTQIFTKLWL